MLETSVLLVGVIKMILYLGTGGNENIFSWKIWWRIERLDRIRIRLESDRLVIASLLTVIAVRKISLELFEDIIFFIPFHIYLGL